MAVLDTVPAGTRAPVARWQPWLALGLALLGATSYVVALLLPYYANDLHHRPAGESLYLHEMSGLWPYDSSLGWLVGLMALFVIMMGPFVAFGVAVWSGCGLLGDRRTPRLTMVWVAALVVSTATFGWLLTPLAGELVAWLLD